MLSSIINLTRLIAKKYSYSADGIRETWQSERSFRQWFGLVVVSDIGALIFTSDIFMISLIVAIGFLLLAAELINTAVEAVVDLVSPQKHVLAKKAKDAASAMTLVTLMALCAAWIGTLVILVTQLLRQAGA